MADNKNSAAAAAAEDDLEMEEEEEEEEDLGPDYSNRGDTTTTSRDVFNFLTSTTGEESVVVSGISSLSSSGFLNRPMLRAVPGPLHNTHGSVDFSQGDTRVLVGVYGPSEVRMAKELPHRAAVDVVFRHKVALPGGGGGGDSSSSSSPVVTSERSLELRLTSLLESVLILDSDDTTGAGAGLNVIAHEVNDNGGLYSVVVNSVCLALLEGGSFPMRSTFAAVALHVDNNNGTVTFHPPAANNKSAPGSSLTVVFGNDGLVLQVESTRLLLPPRVLSSAIAAAWPAATEIFNFFHKFTKHVHQ